MKDIHIGAHINTHSLVFTNPIAKYITSLHFKDVFNKKTSYLGLVNTFYGFLIERVLKEWVIPGQAGNSHPKPKCDLSSKIKFLVDQLFIPVSTLYLHSFFALKVQVAAQSLF